jgi:hypothetical protein
MLDSLPMDGIVDGLCTSSPLARSGRSTPCAEADGSGSSSFVEATRSPADAEYEPKRSIRSGGASGPR